MKPSLGKKEQAERTRAQIIEAARDLFARKGFASTSTQDVAKAIGMTPGVLYWHFESKEDILVAVIDDLKVRMGASLKAARKEIEGSGKASPEELLVVGMDRVMRAIRDHYRDFVFVGVLGAEFSGVNARIEHALREAYRPFGHGIAVLLRMREGAGPAREADLELAGQMYVGLVMGGIMHQRLFRDEMPLERALPVLHRMTKAGLTAQASKPRIKKPRRK